MKTTHPSGYASVALFSVRRLWPVLAAVIVSATASPQSGSATVEPKTHTLFMGADLSIEQNRKLYRVQDIVGDSFVIKVDGREVKVPVKQDALKLKLDAGFKLTENSASLVNLKGERAFTPGNDPSVRLQKSLAKGQLDYSDSQTQQRMAIERLAYLENTPAQQAPTAPGGAGSTGRKDYNQILRNNAAADVAKANIAPGTDFRPDAGTIASEEAFDAMEISFEASSERPLDTPYVVVVAQYRAPGAKVGQVGNWIYAKTLPPLTREGKKVHFLQGGFPRGFELLDLQVRLYNRGEEIATDVVPKRVPLTRDEAFQYVMIEYVSSHKDATLPATPAMGKLPSDWPTRVASGQFKQTYYVSVAKDGKPTGIFADKSCSQKVADPYLEAAVKNFRFKPALQKGKPVDGVASVNFAELAI